MRNLPFRIETGRRLCSLGPRHPPGVADGPKLPKNGNLTNFARFRAKSPPGDPPGPRQTAKNLRFWTFGENPTFWPKGPKWDGRLLTSGASASLGQGPRAQIAILAI